MVGPPARGKSTIATKLKDNLRHDLIRTRIFNNGDLRRKMIPQNTSYSHFYDPENKEAVAIRERIARINIAKAKRYLDKKGHVAILDATNVSRARRQMIQEQFKDHPMLFIECINEDRDILEASISMKIKMPEFSHLTEQEAIRHFKERITYYLSIYLPLKKEENYIRLDSLNNKIIDEKIEADIPYYDRLRDFLVMDTVKSLYLIRHGETYFNLEDRIGGNSELTKNGRDQAKALAEHFKDKKIPLIFTSKKKRTIQTAEPIKALQNACTIVPLAEFNEIHAGICECMSYEEIRLKIPDVYQQRKKDKYHYVYPGGEGYDSMKERIDRGIKKALYLSNHSGHIMIVGHRAANRMILSHFLFRRQEDVPYIYVPQDKFYYISATQNKKVFQLMRYQ
jgi:broad specificity phosphatase PhoE/predicted kinase